MRHRQSGYNSDMSKRVIHVSDAEAANDFAALLDRVREGAEIVIEIDKRPVAVVRAAGNFRGRLLSESIALAKAHAKELGYEPTMDADFAKDVEAAIESHREPEPSRMGLVLDSSLLIAGERRGQRVWDVLERVQASQ
jgi:antitoxin (DNA-binding transcriptional repressor) of toxin-antitoxin stability system